MAHRLNYALVRKHVFLHKIWAPHQLYQNGSRPALPTDRKSFPNGERPKVPKRVSNLWKELLEGEISLEDSTPPKRTVHMACVTMTHNTRNMLLYSHQEMSDGAIRLRNRPDRNGRWPKTAWEAVEIARALG